MNLAEELDRAIGDGPEHQPLERRLTAAHRAVRRRRGMQIACTVCVLAVVAAIAPTFGASERPGSVASEVQAPDPYEGIPAEDRRTEPTLSRDSPVGLDLAGNLVILRGVIVRQTIENPMGLAPPGYSMGVEFELDQQKYWRLLHVDATTESAVFMEGAPREKTFEEWVFEASEWAKKNRESIGE